MGDDKLLLLAEIIKYPHDGHGHVAVLPVGMSQISSVVFESAVTAGAEVKKGDPLGRFLFGGSDIVMIFEKGAGFEITVPAAGDVHEHVLSLYRYLCRRISAKLPIIYSGMECSPSFIPYFFSEVRKAYAG